MGIHEESSSMSIFVSFYALCNIYGNNTKTEAMPRLKYKHFNDKQYYSLKGILKI